MFVLIFGCLMIGGLLGFGCAAMCVIAKEADKEINNESSLGIEKYLKKPMEDIKLINYKETLKLIIEGDISLYKGLYQKSNNTYYLGRVKECEFVLKLINKN